ncbi:MAG: ABC transporter substrate-binding protein [Desulfurococcaceae archaeon]
MNLEKTIVSVFILMLILPIILGIFINTEAQVLPREQMLITGGAWWEPPKKWNPFNYGGAMSGTVGLIYEPLYIWIPIKPENERWVPWLAADLPQWETSTKVVIKLRDQAKWWDGKPITADDVIFTFYDVPRKVPSCTWGQVANYITSVEKINDKTVRFVFTSDANYADFLNRLYAVPILPKHVLETFVNQYGDELVDLGKWPIVAENKDPTKIVASGMYRIYALADDHFILERVENWWGKDVFGLPGPKYIKGVVVYSNQVAANMLGAGELDWSTFYIPGGPDMVKAGRVVSYYKDYPLYLPSNVAFLFVNTQKEPFNDPNFRKAMYFAINVNELISAAFEGVVTPSNPVGLLPYWDKYLAADLIQQYGYGYNPDKAKQILDQAGYVDRDGDGCRDMPNGKPLRFNIIVPYGWTDWMFAASKIAEHLQKVGICAVAQFPDYSLYIDMIDKGTYDAAINNFGSQASPHPYTLYYWAYRASPGIWTGNHGRYNNTQLNQLIDQLSRIPPLPEYDDQMKSVLRDIQKILLDEMPALPLWYNAYWFLATTKYWTGWPNQDNPYAVPTNWNGMWQHGGMLVLLKLKPSQETTSPVATQTPTTVAGVDVTLVIGIVAALIIIVIAVAFILMRKRK